MAKAANNIPNNLVITATPVRPTNFSSAFPAKKHRNTSSTTSKIIRFTEITFMRLPPVSLDINITAAIAPGPAISGIASGNIEGSGISSAALFFRLSARF